MRDGDNDGWGKREMAGKAYRLTAGGRRVGPRGIGSYFVVVVVVVVVVDVDVRGGDAEGSVAAGQQGFDAERVEATGLVRDRGRGRRGHVQQRQRRRWRQQLTVFDGNDAVIKPLLPYCSDANDKERCAAAVADVRLRSSCLFCSGKTIKLPRFQRTSPGREFLTTW